MALCIYTRSPPLLHPNHYINDLFHCFIWLWRLFFDFVSPSCFCVRDFCWKRQLCLIFVDTATLMLKMLEHWGKIWFATQTYKFINETYGMEVNEKNRQEMRKKNATDFEDFHWFVWKFFSLSRSISLITYTHGINLPLLSVILIPRDSQLCLFTLSLPHASFGKKAIYFMK